MPQLDFSTFTAQIFWLAIIFLAQYLMASKFIIPKFKSITKKRQKYTEEQIEIAQKLTNQAATMQKEYDMKLEEIRNANIQEMQKAIKRIDAENQEKIEAIENKLKKDFKEHEVKISEMEKSISKDMDSICASVAASIISKVTYKRVSQSKFSKYIN